MLNILVTPDKKVVFIDFDISTWTDKWTDSEVEKMRAEDKLYNFLSDKSGTGKHINILD